MLGSSDKNKETKNILCVFLIFFSRAPAVNCYRFFRKKQKQKQKNSAKLTGCEIHRVLYKKKKKKFEEHVTILYDVKAKQHVIKDPWTDRHNTIFSEKDAVKPWFNTVFEFVFLSSFLIGCLFYKWTIISERIEALKWWLRHWTWTLASRIEFAILCGQWIRRRQFRFFLFPFLQSVSVQHK